MQIVIVVVFLSTLSLRRATPVRAIVQWEGIFLSTLSLRRATDAKHQTYQPNEFLSTLSLRRATQLPHLPHLLPCISIHALLAESDNLRVVDGSKSSIISIHALLAESDPPVRAIVQWEGIFLSTLSLRRATRTLVGLFLGVLISIHALLAESDSSTPAVRSQFMYFYPRSPCGERLLRRNADCNCRSISIHALLAESD